MPYRRTPKVQARMDTQRAAIRKAAVDLLSEQGYAGCSMAAVAARAGVATGSVYKHFPSKTELVVELFRYVVTHEVEAVSQAAEQPGDLVARVVSVVETFTSRALKSPGWPTPCSWNPWTSPSRPNAWSSAEPSAT
ncbi:hypothetical protein GCM10029964_050370 [Kibdelosporangium lantanae]